MKNIFADKIKQAYDAISHIWHEKREWYIEQAPIDGLITQLPKKATILDVATGSWGRPPIANKQSVQFQTGTVPTGFPL